MTGITEAKRRAAFGVWGKVFDQYGINLADAGKPFRKRWIETPSEFSDELTFAADILWAISKSLTEKSVPIFAEKVRALVQCRRENDYVMRLSELELPGLLGSRVSPIAFEPAVPIDADSAAKPSSCDHSICMPSGEVFIEATTMELRHQTSTDAFMKQLDAKLDDKRRQAARDRVYLLALKILGTEEGLALMRQLVNERVWPNRKFRRYGGVFTFGAAQGGSGVFDGLWQPNPFSIAPPSKDVTDLLCGRRCFHLHRIRTLEVSNDEVACLRRRVAKASFGHRGVGVPVELLNGPLDGLDILLRPTQAGDAHIIFAWDMKARAKIKGEGTDDPAPRTSPDCVQAKRRYPV